MMARDSTDSQRRAFSNHYPILIKMYLVVETPTQTAIMLPVFQFHWSALFQTVIAKDLVVGL